MKYPDILILFGGEKELVKDIQLFFNCLKLDARAVTDDGSAGKNQKEKVEGYITNCQIAVVLATFDPKNKKANTVRPNVLHELTLCTQLKKESTIVLIEERGRNQVVDLGSNLDGHIIKIPFRRDRMGDLHISIMKEFNSRDLKFFGDTRPTSDTPSISDQLRTFLDKMDDIWEQEFDKANMHIIRHDWKTERKFDQNLDYFFWKYWDVFNAVVREEKSGDEMNKIIRESISEGLKLACQTWEVVANSKLDDLENLLEPSSRDANVNRKSIEGCVNEAQKLLNHAKARKQKESEKIEIYKKAISLINDCH